jgi:hypothetical protein
MGTGKTAADFPYKKIEMLEPVQHPCRLQKEPKIGIFAVY